MTNEELEIKKFEFTQKLQLDEFELKKRELDLRIQEQKTKKILTPLLVSIVGGLITIMTGLVLKYYDSKALMRLEDKKLQSSLLLKATDAKSYEDFSNMLGALSESGLLQMDSVKLAKFKKNRLISDLTPDHTEEQHTQIIHEDTLHAPVPLLEHLPSNTDTTKVYWAIVTSSDKKLDEAMFEQKKAVDNKFENPKLWYKDFSYILCVGKYFSYADAVNDLFEVKEKLNSTAYIVRMDSWCTYSKFDDVKKVWYCN